jgi:hypothetical protein
VLYIHSPIRLHGIVLNLLNTETTLPFFFLLFEPERAIQKEFRKWERRKLRGRYTQTHPCPSSGSDYNFQPYDRAHVARSSTAVNCHVANQGGCVQPLT